MTKPEDWAEWWEIVGPAWDAEMDAFFGRKVTEYYAKHTENASKLDRYVDKNLLHAYPNLRAS